MCVYECLYMCVYVCDTINSYLLKFNLLIKFV